MVFPGCDHVSIPADHVECSTCGAVFPAGSPPLCPRVREAHGSVALRIVAGLKRPAATVCLPDGQGFAA
jgi:hypothetical protein